MKLSWFARWRGRLIDRLRRLDWPEGDNVWWSDLERLVADTGCDETAATAAITSLFRDPPPYLDQYPGAIVAAIEALDDGKKRTRAEAEFASKGCPECGGDGCTVRFIPTRRHGIRRVAMICHRCAAGQWMRDWRGKEGESSPIPDLMAYPQYQDELLAREWNPEWVRPAPKREPVRETFPF